MVANFENQERFATLLAAVTRQWKHRLDMRFKVLGLTQARWAALFELSRLGEATQIDLANALGVEAPTVVRIVDWMEKAGKVERRRTPDDRRVHVLRLTQNAEPIVKSMKQIAIEARAELLSDISPHELDTAIAVLGRIAARLDRVKNG